MSDSFSGEGRNHLTRISGSLMTGNNGNKNVFSLFSSSGNKILVENSSAVVFSLHFGICFRENEDVTGLLSLNVWSGKLSG